MNTSPDYLGRQNRLCNLIRQSKISAIALNPGASFFYLTGLQFHLMERPTIVLFTADHSPVIILPELEANKISNVEFPLKPYFIGEYPEKWVETIKEAINSIDHLHQVIGVESTRLRFLELNLISSAAPESKCVSADHLLTELRVCKEPDEIQKIRQAVAIAQVALQLTLPKIKKGMTEKEIASELTLQLLKSGSHPEIPFSPIVSAGFNSADPHATPSDKRLLEGELLVIDWGANVDGYLSDLTRTFSIGKPAPIFQDIHAIVLEANQRARQGIKPEVTASRIDDITRQWISSQNYGKYFTHRTGHGLGLEAHEDPYIRSGNMQILQPGMVFTIEPGIYLPGEGGVRIEDNVVLIQDGVDTLSDLDRSLIQIG
jgi:Xaa-Pro dipeptidase